MRTLKRNIRICVCVRVCVRSTISLVDRVKRPLCSTIPLGDRVKRTKL